MATGDLKNNLKKLHFELRRIRLPQHLQNTDGFSSGDAMSYLPVYEYLFDWYSASVTQYINERNFKLLPYQQDKNKFLEVMYLILREVFNWKPSLTITQFLSPGFVEHKVMMCTEISRRIRERHFELEMKGTEKKPATHGGIKLTMKSLPANFATNDKKDKNNCIGDVNTTSNFGDITSTEYDSQLSVMTMEMYQKLQDCCEEVKEMKHHLTSFETKLQELNQKVNSLNLKIESCSSHNSSGHNSPT